MTVVLDSGLDGLVTVTAQTFGKTHVGFNDVLVWLSMNPPAVYLVKYISHNSCLPELSITEVQYIPSNYGQVYKKTPKLSKVREQDQCMFSHCGNALDLAFGSIRNQRQHLQDMRRCLRKPKTVGGWGQGIVTYHREEINVGLNNV